MSIDIPLNYTASDRVTEQRLAYFREDIGVNLHHWHWHLVYPAEGPERIVRKDRRGELFYYMHQQMIARYQVERYSQGLGRVTPLDNLRTPIPEPYYPKILRSANNRTYPARYANMTLEDVIRPNDGLRVIISEVERQLQRIIAAIDEGVVVAVSTCGECPYSNDLILRSFFCSQADSAHSWTTSAASIYWAISLKARPYP